MFSLRGAKSIKQFHDEMGQSGHDFDEEEDGFNSNFENEGYDYNFE